MCSSTFVGQAWLRDVSIRVKSPDPRATSLCRVELLLDVLNALNDTAEESVATDNLFSPNFGRPTLFVDPRRPMLGVRMNLGRP